MESVNQPKGLELSQELILWCLRGRKPVQSICTKKKAEKRDHSGEMTNQQPGDDLLPLDRFACKSSPPEVQLCRSSVPGNKFGVMATTLIPQDVLIGPYQGKLVQPEQLEKHVDGTHLWEIFHENQLRYFVDGSDENASCWMHFIQCARTMDEQNVSAFQHQDCIIYRVLRDIHAGEELLVWYDEQCYPQYMGVPFMDETVTSIRKGTFHTDNNDTNRNHFNLSTPRSTSVIWTFLGISNKQDVGFGPPLKVPKTWAKEERSLITKAEHGSLEDQKRFSITAAKEDQSELSRKRLSSTPTTVSEPPLLNQHTDVSDAFESLTCGQCDKTFLQRYLLRMHLCPKQSNAPYQCGHCQLSFTNPSDLRGHVVRHVGEKPFKCGFCARTFVGATTLNNHIRMHTGEKPFKHEDAL